MTDFTSLITSLEEAWRNTAGSIVAYLPTLAGSVLLLLIGWLLARWARAGVHKLGEVFNRVIQRVLEGTSVSRFRFTSRSLQIVGNAIFWLVILVFLTAAAKTARLNTFSIWLDRILSYVPELLAGGLIIAAGYLASVFIRDVVVAAFVSGGFRQSALLGRLIQAAVFLTAVVIGIDQVGLDISFLVTVIAISLAGLFGGVALSFGFGSRDFVANVIAAHNVQQYYKPGQVVRLGRMQGEILEITPTSIILATEEGRTMVPAKVFHSSTSILVTPEGASE